MKFDIPTNFVVEAYSEEHAEELLTIFLSRAIKRAGLQELIQHEYFEFIAKEPCSGRRRNDNNQQGKSTHSKEQVCDNSSKGECGCC